MDHDSSAYGSGSDGFHSSSSPCGSEHNSRDSNPASNTPYASSHLNENIQIPHYYSTPKITQLPNMPYNNPITSFNPLTPPNTEPIVSPQNHSKLPEQAEVTPPKSPTSSQDGNGNYYSKDGEDHLKRLQMAFERNTMLPDSPKGSDNRDSADEDGKSDYEFDEVDEQGMRIPRVNSHGKVKTFKCKQCEFVAVTKLDFWEHTRGHIKVEKLLTCPKCPFVTEYKHHLEYHLRNHFGSKPFRCDKCSYTCVNKSMLNSHLKSHSNVYQYRCADCTYATKYCHSLKLHLRKYSHNPAMVLNPDGTPNPLPIIDVYGTRRGPKQKSNKAAQETEEVEQPNQSQMQTQHQMFSHFMVSNSQALPFPYGPLLAPFSNPLLFPQINQMSNPSSPESQDEDSRSTIKQTEDEEESTQQPPAALDLSKPEISLPITIPEVPTPMNASSNKNRRKGRAYKLERVFPKEDCSEDEKPQPEPEPQIEQQVKEVTTKKDSDIFNCQYCDMAFRDIVMYTMHMGYHGYKDPFTCNMCGEQSADKVSFFLHIARTSHS